MFRRTSVLGAALLALTWLTTFVLAAPSAGCGRDPTLRSQTYNINVNGRNRQYILRVPNNYDKNRPYKLVFLWHPRGGSMQKIVNGEDPNRGGILPYHGLLSHANESAIFVVPEGLNQGWANNGNEDTNFFDRLVETVESQLCVETSLRFSTGFSWGGGMSFALACARPRQIRAIAVISGGLLSGCQGGTEPVAYYAQHGTRDSVLNVGMGRQLRDQFVRNNGCQRLSYEPQPNGGRSVRTDYQGCRPGYPVTWVVHDGDHNPSQVDAGSNTPFAPKNTWDFFSQFQAQ
ncbi:hypothetical protein VTJ83DRAFT_3651 [Remersonia thermophila]|uniref:feruloyl esterase n=1 Tax=Remersonia thermophila TaxID=72144 RepID=A0ABR4DEM4_9PEZI